MYGGWGTVVLFLMEFYCCMSLENVSSLRPIWEKTVVPARPVVDKRTPSMLLALAWFSPGGGRLGSCHTLRFCGSFSYFRHKL